MMLDSDSGGANWDATAAGQFLQDEDGVIAVEEGLAVAEGGAEAQHNRISIIISEPDEY